MLIGGEKATVGLTVLDEDERVRTLMAVELARMFEGGRLPTSLKIVGYVMATIETLEEGDYVISRDENDPDGPLIASRITKKYERIAYHLQLVGFGDGKSRRQLIQTTDEHPFGAIDRGWTKSRYLEIGDKVRGPSEIASTVTSNARESRPEGVKVYNMEIDGTHTYFMRADGSDAEPVWVHNAAGEDYDLAPKNDAESAAYHDFLKSEYYESGWDSLRANSNEAGRAGEEIAALSLPEGHQVLGSQVHIDVEVNGKAVCVIVDHVVADEAGNIYYLDAKNGPTARLTRNQMDAYDLLETNGGTYVGKQLSGAGYQAGDVLPSGRVLLFKP